ncbi:MAG TPA: hypothetical protein VII06_17150 [Chloroflexota bacterium]|jgi:hypothetical protein
MGICAAVECPGCHEEFVVSPSMLRADTRLLVGPATEAGRIEFHCPFCNLAFPKEQSPSIRE